MARKKKVPKNATIMSIEDRQRLLGRKSLFEATVSEAERMQAVAAMVGEAYGVVVRELREKYDLSRVYSVDENGVVTNEPDPPEEPADE